MKPEAKERTLDEFKNWLEGLTEFHPADWSPSREQWDIVIAAMMNIQEKKNIHQTPSPIQQSPVVNPTHPLSQSIVPEAPPAFNFTNDTTKITEDNTPKPRLRDNSRRTGRISDDTLTPGVSLTSLSELAQKTDD
jgi:hypothetical protein